MRKSLPNKTFVFLRIVSCKLTFKCKSNANENKQKIKINKKIDLDFYLSRVCLEAAKRQANTQTSSKNNAKQQESKMLKSMSNIKLHCCLAALILFIFVFLSLPLLLIHLANNDYYASKRLAECFPEPAFQLISNGKLQTKLQCLLSQSILQLAKIFYLKIAKNQK